jgi:hypothetical protein
MFLDKYLNRKAYTQLLVGSILAIMIGSVLLIISYVVINAIVISTPMTGALAGINTSLNQSFQANIVNIQSALNIGGIALIVVGISGIIYMLIGLGQVGGGSR